MYMHICIRHIHVDTYVWPITSSPLLMRISTTGGRYFILIADIPCFVISHSQFSLYIPIFTLFHLQFSEDDYCHHCYYHSYCSYYYPYHYMIVTWPNSPSPSPDFSVCHHLPMPSTGRCQVPSGPVQQLRVASVEQCASWGAFSDAAPWKSPFLLGK